MIYWRRAALHPPPFICASAMAPMTWASDGRKIRHALARSHFVQANGPPAAPTMIDETSNNHLGDVGRGNNPPFVSSVGNTLARIVTAHSVQAKRGSSFGIQSLWQKKNC